MVFGAYFEGHWLLYDLVSDVADYDELLTGQRREGQLTRLGRGATFRATDPLFLKHFKALQHLIASYSHF